MICGVFLNNFRASDTHDQIVHRYQSRSEAPIAMHGNSDIARFHKQNDSSQQRTHSCASLLLFDFPALICSIGRQ